MNSVPTVKALQNQNYTLALYCIPCDRCGEANLDWLIQNGKGDKLVAESRFRYQNCGEIVEEHIRPPVPPLGGVGAPWLRALCGFSSWVQTEWALSSGHG